jgi:4-amino-4-deoxy-L-arabinose transferase-like glycosyltransferase
MSEGTVRRLRSGSTADRVRVAIRAPRRLSIGMPGLLRRVPSAALVCASIAFLNAAAWSLIVPPFQGKDESEHFAYVEQLAENGTLPESATGAYSPGESLVLGGLHYQEVVHAPETPAISSEAEQRTLMQDVNAGASLRGTGNAGVAASEPPLYYALETIPYALGGSNLLTKLQLMRLLGALFGAITALLCFLFIREVLPGTPWAATVGGLCVALQPLLAFMSGSVNPDSLFYAVSAAVFLCLARAFRRGLSRRLAVALGAAIAIGFLTKLNFVGLALGVFLGLALLAARGLRARGRRGLYPPALAAGIGVVPVALYAVRNILTNRPTFGIVSGGTGLVTTHSLLHQISYIWQLYLPRLPGMTPYFAGIATYKDIWFDRSVGLYGWMDTVFPTWVDNVALVLAAAVALLLIRELLRRRAALRARTAELVVYATMTLGVLVLIGASSYVSDVLGRGAAFGEPRYLLPLLPLLGAALALAVRGAGRRWAPVVGAALVVLFLGHDVFSQLQTIARYYG